jgi:hypothetical protein
MGFIAIRPAIERFLRSGSEIGGVVGAGGAPPPAGFSIEHPLLQKVCVAWAMTAAAVTGQAFPLVLIVVVVPWTEQPLTVWEQLVA